MTEQSTYNNIRVQGIKMFDLILTLSTTDGIFVKYLYRQKL